MVPPVDRVAFTIFGVDVMWYAIIIATGMLVGVYFAEKEFKRRGLDPDKLMDILVVALPVSIIGARAYYVAFEWDFYSQNPSEILNIRGGGLAIYGGIIAAFIAGFFMTKVKKLDFLQVADMVAPSLAIGQSIGRWGNFINQEAHGYETDLPWAVLIDGVKYHPTFLYESIGNLIIFLILTYIMRKKQKFDGQIIILYMILYGFVRYFVEGLRTDSLYFMGFRVSQIVSIAGIVIGILLYFILKKRNENLSKL